MKKLLLILFFILIISGLFGYFYQKNKKVNYSDRFLYNPSEQKWEKAVNQEKDPLYEDREVILANYSNQDGLHNPKVIRAYFYAYDEESQKLKARVLIPFTQSGLFEEAEIKLLPTQNIYCVPAIYVDPNNGQNFETKNLLIPVKEGSALWIPTEKPISFQQFLSNSSERTFLYLQLTSNYQQESLNYAQKIIAIGLCE